MLNKKLNNILRYPEKIPADKRLHALLGLVFIDFMLIGTSNLYILVGSLIIFAHGIEYGQKWTKSGTYDNWDAISVDIGGLLALFAHII